MKNLIRIMVIIGMVSGGILIFPIIFGIKALKELDEAMSPKDLQNTAILTLIFVNMIAGVLMLVIKESDLADNVNEISNPYTKTLVDGESCDTRSNRKALDKHSNGTKVNNIVYGVMSIVFGVILCGCLFYILTIRYYGSFYYYYIIEEYPTLSSILISLFLAVFVLNIINMVMSKKELSIANASIGIIYNIIAITLGSMLISWNGEEGIGLVYILFGIVMLIYSVVMLVLASVKRTNIERAVPVVERRTKITNNHVVAIESTMNFQESIDAIKKITDLYQADLINEDEYNEKRKKYISML